jgi:hypothetical protein
VPLPAPEPDQSFPEELSAHPEQFETYKRLVHHELSDLRPIDIASVVSADYVFDFTILYESLVESRALYPFRLHAYALDDGAHSRLAEAGLAGVEVHRAEASSGDSWQNVAPTIALVERSGLDRCLVSDVDNVFVQETPELFLLLDRSDFAFVASPRPDWPIQTNIWGFRSNARSRRFAREWARHASGRRLSATSGLPFALLERDPELRVTVLTRPAEAGHEFVPAPYDFQVTNRKIAPRADRLGFKHPQVGRAKIVHLGGLRGSANDSVGARIEALVTKFPHCLVFLPHYVTLANRAAGKLGMETLPDPLVHLRREMGEAGILAHRRELPTLLNERGLLGSAVEIGVAKGAFSEHILTLWRGAHLLSVDPWRAAPPDEYVDRANRSQEEHDEAYERTKQRLAQFGERSSVWRMTSIEAASRIPPGSLDFAYLDGRHDYESVKEDLELWYDKLRPGGIFAGHDYCDGVLPQGVFGVRSAVNEFFGAKGLPVKATYVDAPWSSWYVDIPGSRPNGN